MSKRFTLAHRRALRRGGVPRRPDHRGRVHAGADRRDSPAHAPAARATRRVPALTGAPMVVNFADVAERMNAAVVNIDSTSKRGEPRDRAAAFISAAEPDPGRRAISTRRARAPAAASSSIAKGSSSPIITSSMRPSGSRVTLADGRAFRGEVVGTDPAIDVALLKIAGSHDLPEAPLGNSDELRVGEWVCAIGNPLGYVHSVTVGVVSFIGRKLFDASLDDYIQTDAAINFGNSGGPLINSRGEVIGINSAISSRASNIGFAVPINQAVGDPRRS